MINNEYISTGSFTGPHIKEKWSSQWIMHQVLIALLFPTFAAIYFFGFWSVIMILISISACVGFEYFFQTIFGKRTTISDCSAVITGWLLALTLPVTVALWILLVGDFIAVIVIKQLTGGIGRNWLNPAVAARVLLKLCFSPWLTNGGTSEQDVVASVTPLVDLGSFSRDISTTTPDVFDLFFGINLGGAIGETCKFVLLFSAVFLIIRKIINPFVPIITIGSFYLLILIYSVFNFSFANAHLLSGALVFSAIFMVTDYTTSPITDKGKYIFALGCGVFTALLRISLDLPGGIGVAILVMNLLTPLINKYTASRVYGE
ncbi:MULTISPECIES: RnfABCDGE type electron transport complex subunit D [unclassified Enterococcus]|uniref:RnfABCDGE type electron transport complex subunit D n=1 Tax=unclassified Enterococcus TaxID=2608891 RepID=UPI001CE114EC|nr:MULTISPECIES: RnfABCDGE type electron transport complex subunit D [unclassified Enterococcus]